MLFFISAADRQPVLIFFSGSHSTPDVALRLVQVQDNSSLSSQRRIDGDKPFRTVFMYCRF